MWQEALVNGEETLGTDGLAQAVKDALVKISILVVETRHDSICHS